MTARPPYSSPTTSPTTSPLPSPTPNPLPSPPNNPTPSPTPEVPLGTLSLEENQVLHGQDESALERLLEKASFFEKDFIQVIEGGEAVLDFGDEMRLRLFNDTELQMVAAELAENVPLGVQVFLFVGGFTGELTEEGGQAVFRTPGDVEITVLGTEYFVVFDPETGETTAGNFSGTVAVASAGDEVSLEDGSYVVVPDSSSPGPPLPLPLTREEFEDQAREAESPLQAASKAKEWTLEISHEFVYDYADHWEWAPGPPTFLRSWNGQFTLEGDKIVGSGTGVIDDVNLKCNNFSDPRNVIELVFNIEGGFDFDIGGQLVTGDDGSPTFLIEITNHNFSTNSLDEVYETDGNCDYFSEFFLDVNRSTVEDFPLLGVEALIIEAADGAQTVVQLDASPYNKWTREVSLGYTYEDFHFNYPLEVTVTQSQ